MRTQIAPRAIGKFWHTLTVNASHPITEADVRSLIVAGFVCPGFKLVCLADGQVGGFAWTSLTYDSGANTYREKARDYVAAAQVLGAGIGARFSDIFGQT